MGIPVHIIDQLNGSQFNREDRVMMGFLPNVATPASATSVTALGSITAGTGFTSLSTVSLAPTGGTGSGLTAIPTSLKAVTATELTPGTHYAINDTITLAGGTLQPGGPGAATVLTVSKAQLISAAINAGGASSSAGYAAADVLTLVGGTFTTAAQITVDTVDGGGGILTFHVSRAGVYSVEASTFTVTGGTGTGATFQTAVWGVQAVTISTAGAYSTAPSTSATQGSTSGSGTGATFTMAYGLGTAQITNSGNYTGAPSMTVTDSAGGTGASIGSCTLGGNGNPIFIPITFDLPANYGVFVETSMNCTTYVPYASKLNTGFSIALVPPSGTTLGAGTMDVQVIA